MKNITFERELSIYTQIYTLRTITNTKAVDKVFLTIVRKRNFLFCLSYTTKKERFTLNQAVLTNLH